MDDALVQAFRSELPCGEPEAVLLANLARRRVPLITKSTEDSDEDLVMRLRDPRVFGAFAEAALEDSRVSKSTRTAVVEHAFDLLPLPRTEGEVILVDARAPPRLLALAAHLASTEGLSVLHVMHLVYALFLDRSLVSHVPRSVRSTLLKEVVGQTDTGEGLRVLYVAFHLSAVPASEAHAEFRGILHSPSISRTLKRALATLVAADDGGRAALRHQAETEGLLPSDIGDAQSPPVLANIPRLPERLAALGRRHLRKPRGA